MNENVNLDDVRFFPATHSGGSLEDKLHTLYNGVETFALFIGHGRSGHSLVGAILDAHPEIVIAHEFDVLNGITGAFYKKIRLFFDLHSLSRQQALFENRASCPARADNHRYCYNVPGQWQGTYKTKIKVNDEFSLKIGRLLMSY